MLTSPEVIPPWCKVSVHYIKVCNIPSDSRVSGRCAQRPSLVCGLGLDGRSSCANVFPASQVAATLPCTWETLDFEFFCTTATWATTKSTRSRRISSWPSIRWPARLSTVSMVRREMTAGFSPLWGRSTGPPCLTGLRGRIGYLRLLSSHLGF